MSNVIKKIKILWLTMFNPPFSAGLKAELVFEKQALAHHWLVEKISQDKKSFEKYKKIANASVKRGDYICRNCANVEIEVKCKTIYGKRNEQYYLLPYSHIKRHMEMNKITHSSTVFAFYERKGAGVLETSLRMIDLDFLLGTYDYKNGTLYDKANKCLKIPLKYTQKNFKVLHILAKK